MTRTIGAFRRICRSGVRPAVALAIVLFGHATAWASPITVNFSGIISAVDAPLAGTFSAGQVLSGSFTYESSTAPRAGGTSMQSTFDALTNLTFTVSAAGYSASSGGAPEIQIDNDCCPGTSDRFAVISRASEGLTGPAVNGHNLFFFGLALFDNTGTTYSTALVLPTAVSQSSFDGSFFGLGFMNSAGAPANVELRVTGVSTVPEPSTLLLLGAGLAVGIARMRRR